MQHSMQHGAEISFLLHARVWDAHPKSQNSGREGGGGKPKRPPEQRALPAYICLPNPAPDPTGEGRDEK